MKSHTIVSEQTFLHSQSQCTPNVTYHIVTDEQWKGHSLLPQ